MTFRRELLKLGGAAFLASPASAIGSATSPMINVKDHGAVGDSVHDDTAAIQAAMDAGGPGSVIFFPNTFMGSGTYYKITTTLRWYQGQQLLGSSMTGSAVIWHGPPGGTMLIRAGSPPGTGVGGNSYGSIRDMTFAGQGIFSQLDQSSTWPATVVEFASTPLDFGMHVTRSQFGCCTGDAIKIRAGWINAWFDHIRWDGVVGYCINAKSVLQNGSSFVVDTFAVDNQPSTTSASKWGFRFDVSDVASPSGPITLRNARVESTTGALASDSAFVTLVSNTAYEVPLWNLYLSDIFFDKGAGMSGNFSLIRHLGTAAGGQLSFELARIRLGWQPSTPLITGNVPTGLVQRQGHNFAHWSYGF